MLAARELVRDALDDVRALDAAFPSGSAAGMRYPAESMRLLEAEQAR